VFGARVLASSQGRSPAASLLIRCPKLEEYGGFEYGGLPVEDAVSSDESMSCCPVRLSVVVTRQVMPLTLALSPDRCAWTADEPPVGSGTVKLGVHAWCTLSFVKCFGPAVVICSGSALSD
jgi:hypothetical protein